MEQNVGKFDRVIRIALGVALGTAAAATVGIGTDLGATAELALAAVLLAVGVVFLATGVARTCPLYGVLGVNTCAVRDGVGRDRRGEQRS
jgi:hypothetical protein